MNQKTIVRTRDLIKRIEKAQRSNQLPIRLKLYCPSEVNGIRDAGYVINSASERHWYIVSE